MVTLKRSDSEDTDFHALVRLLDQDLAKRDGEEHAFFAQFNTLTSIRQVVVAYRDGKAVGCGAFKPYQNKVAEIKRMFVHPDYRRQGIARQVLTALEVWAFEKGFTSCLLETGEKQPEAIALYKMSGYELIPNYGQYAEVKSSVCMKKELRQPRDESAQ